uniref:Uncharacterized protein n=1 Tax=Ditylenchus dipsaci TaxID=166011 RepID=A0A915CSK0_9BILA
MCPTSSNIYYSLAIATATCVSAFAINSFYFALILCLDARSRTGIAYCLSLVIHHQLIAIDQQQQKIAHHPNTRAQTTAAAPPVPPSSILTSPTVLLPGEKSWPVFSTDRDPSAAKPQIDIVRYSMANAKDDLDLDTILNELLELENQLSSEADNHYLLHGLPLPPPIKNNKAQFNSSLPQFGSSEILASTASRALIDTGIGAVDLCASPDVDSAFGDSSSTECSSGSGSGAGCTIAEGVNTGTLRHSPVPTLTEDHLTLPHPLTRHLPTQSQMCPRAPLELLQSCQPPLLERRFKSTKDQGSSGENERGENEKDICQNFLEDQTSKGLLIDERWTVGETIRQLADKLKVVLTPEHAILEEYPDLHIKRIYEDHEFVVENIEDWLADSSNKLHFLRLPDKYSFVRNPQEFLLSEKSNNFENFPPAQNSAEWTAEAKQSLIKTFLDSENNAIVPELEGWLMLKADGKKCWKKHYFVLRSSGLYYYPKSNKMRGSKDLQCLMNVYNNQIYTCLDWTKKYKAPTNYGFAIKHPRIQVKTSKYIKYICAEDENTFHKWVTALRITRNGFQVLYKNHCSLADNARNIPNSLPIRVEVPQISLQRLSCLDQSVLSTCSQLSVKSQTNSSANGLPEMGHNSSSSSVSSPVQCLSASRVSVLSHATSDRRQSPASIVFDQDECGTIKRQPMPHEVFPRVQPRLNTPTSSHSNLDDSDSDEDEQFPPPPPLQEVAIQRVLLPVAHKSVGFVDDQITPSRSIVPDQFDQSRPMIPPKPYSLPLTATPRKVPPPPPPKRSEVTQLHNPNKPGGLLSPTHPQMELYSELQKATARQKQRIEGN